MDLKRHEDNAEHGDAFVAQHPVKRVAFYVGWSNNPDDYMDASAIAIRWSLLLLKRDDPQDNNNLAGAEVSSDIDQPLVLGSYSHSIVSNGVFTTGHFGSDGFGQVLAVSKAIGHLLITVKTDIWHDNIPPNLYALWRGFKIWILD